MRFTRIRLSGFKSFGEPAEFLVQPGLTGVVGPNGCGKSNLVEALRWAMGESSARQVRGGGMDDVIFAGAGARPARNVAEVALSARREEDDPPPPPGAADGAMEDIEIARRIERGAGSTYRVNGREARARDVQVLFADAATGAKSAALVSQGEIGALIGARPTERRRLLEEAAGVAGLHARRHEAELRLRAAEANLERLEDIVAAGEARLRSLERQARQAARYRTLVDGLRRAEAALSFRRWADAAAEEAAAAEAFAAATAAAAASARAAARAAAGRERAAEAAPTPRGAASAAAAALARLEGRRRSLEEESRRVAGAAEAAQAQLEDAAAAETREGQLAREAEAAAGRLAGEARRLRESGAGEAGRLAAAEAAFAGERRRVERVEAAAAAAAEAAAEAGGRRDSLARRAAALDARLAELAERRKAAAGERAELAARLRDDRARAAAEAGMEAARRRAVAGAETLDSRRAAANAAADARGAAEAAERKAREALRDAVVAHERAAAEREALAATLAGEGARPLLDRVAAPEDLAPALAAALGDDLLAGDDPRAAAHWRDLSAGLAAKDAPDLPAGALPLADSVAAPTALRARLAQVGLVARADGPVLQAALAQGQRLVSREGDLWRWDGFVAGAEAEGGAARRLALRRRLAALAEAGAALARRRKAAETRASRAAGALAAAAAELDRARAAEAEAARAQAAAAREFEAARERRDAAAAALAGARSRLAAVEEAAAANARDRAEAEAERRECARALAALPAAEALRARATAARYARRTARNDQEAAARRRAALAHAAASRAARLAALDADAADWRRRRAAAADRLRALAERRSELGARLRELREEPGRLAARAAALDADLAAAGAAKRKADDALAEAEARLAAADRAARSADDAAARDREEVIRAEGRRDRARALAAAEAGRIAEAFDCDPPGALRVAGAESADELDSADRLEREAARLRRDRDALGAVNLRAEAEAAELEEEIGGMRGERDDLLAAVARLRDGIGSLDREGRARLMAAFDEVNAHFGDLFARLFGGGQGCLRLVGSDDPLEAGLDVAARPPGKRAQSLSLLSGGEKALAALALLFAVLRARPSPVCVLDEVDAPLDDANVERFCDLLDDIARESRTRFLVVTHHRLTMARMDRLYGVTMAERGVSRLVSVDLAAAAADLAAE